jgi:hypothetical protein
MSFDTDQASSRSETYQLCMQELDRGDLQAAQVYATLSVEEALRDLAGSIHRAASQITRTLR